MVNPAERAVRRLDRLQQNHGPAGFVFAVVKKFGDDRGSSLCALLTYYGFVSLFPLLLVFVTILGFVLGSNPQAQQRLLHSALHEFPVIGAQLGDNIHPLRGHGLVLALGVAGLLYGSFGLANAAQFAMAQVWNLPNVSRPSFWSRLARSAALVALLGLGVVITTVLAGVGTFGRAGAAARAGGLAVSLLLDLGLFTAGFRILTPDRVPLRDLLPGALLGGVGWFGLQAAGSYLVGHQLRHASPVYGVFAVVLGLLSFLYLGSEITLYAAEVSVVRARRLWPRSIVQPPLTAADRVVLAAIAEQEERRPEQDVRVHFRTGAPVDPPG
jgi:YihY family inner membrane protein